MMMDRVLLLCLVCLCGGLVLADVIVYDKSYTIADQFNDLPARFGPLFPLDGLRAYPMMSSDVYGCSAMDGPPKDRVEGKFVVLMARNNCSFFEKVLNAEKAGFDAAIVYNTDSDDLVEMSGDSGSTEDTHIPSMFIGYYSAMEIKNNYLYDVAMKDFIVVMTRDLPFNINTRLLIPFVAVVVLCFLSMIIMAIVKCVRHRNRVSRDRLPKKELRKLPVIRYNPSCRYHTCSICLDDYVEGERLRVLPCLHTYHTKCIDPWLTNGKRNCPMCKRKIRFGPKRSRAERTSSGSSTSSDDTTPLLNPVRNNTTNGTFPEPEPQLPQPGGSSSSSGTGGDSGRPDRFFARMRRRFFLQHILQGPDSERASILPPSVSEIVDTTPPQTPIVDAPTTTTAAVFQAPPPYSVINMTPSSSPFRRAGEPGTSGSAPVLSGTPRIGVAALPNVDFQGAGFLEPPPIAQRTHSRGQGRHNRRRRRGHEDV